ncbi:MAG: hypothetical protein M3041_08075 [Acidobacteriota bacterium]|nr:hypothetical protein [Acidobacteriota bacterium]
MLGISDGEATATASSSVSSGPTAAEVAGDSFDPLSVVFPGMFFGKTQPQAVRMLLEKCKPRPVKMKALLAALEKGGLKIGGKKPDVNLWGVLDRAADTFILVPKAGWGLVEWYDSTVIAKMRAKKGDENGSDSEDGDGDDSAKKKASPANG